MSSISRFFSSISVKVLLILAALFAMIIALVIYLINTQGYPKIKAESEKLLVQRGQQAIDVISSNVKSVERITQDLYSIAYVMPQQDALFKAAIDQKLNKYSMPLVGSGGIWPDKYLFNPSKAGNAFIKAEVKGEYQYIDPKGLFELPYYELGWFKVMKLLKPNKCIWGHAALTSSTNNLAVSCAVTIHKDGKFWGSSAANFRLDLVQKTVENVQKETGGYVLLIDNADHIVASSDPSKIPFISDDKKTVRSFSNFVEENPSLQPVSAAIDAHKQKVSNEILKTMGKMVQGAFALYDKQSKSPAGSGVVNYAAHATDNNVILSKLNKTFLNSFAMANDTVLKESASAVLFNVPDTHWKLLIVKPDSEVNAIASKFRNTLLAYLLGSLILTGLLTYFFINRSALKPIVETARQSQAAADVIDRKEYSLLSGMQFDTDRNDEIGYLNDAMNGLLNKVEENEGQLEYINKELENKVEERTQELQDAMVDLKSSQVQLIRSEKMATLGQMVAGVAHEVNTPLTYVQTNLEMIGLTAQDYEMLFESIDQLKAVLGQPKINNKELKSALVNLLKVTSDVKEDSPVSELQQATSDSLFGVEQISELVINLRDFARLDESKTKNVDIRECVKSSLMMSKNSIKHLEVATQLPEVPLVNCAPSQINQVLINLINNAAQAIPEGQAGKLAISVESDQSNVFINVLDNGKGMSEATQKKIFEPFFTTKKAGEGTGLGMAIAHQIIEQHGGAIQITSKEGNGTKFQISLPIAKA